MSKNLGTKNSFFLIESFETLKDVPLIESGSTVLYNDTNTSVTARTYTTGDKLQMISCETNHCNPSTATVPPTRKLLKFVGVHPLAKLFVHPDKTISLVISYKKKYYSVRVEAGKSCYISYLLESAKKNGEELEIEACCLLRNHSTVDRYIVSDQFEGYLKVGENTCNFFQRINKSLNIQMFETDKKEKLIKKFNYTIQNGSVFTILPDDKIEVRDYIPQ